MSIKKSFTVDRSFWRRGGDRMGHGRTLLRNKQGNSCCLGHIASQCGVPWSDMMGIEYPEGLPSVHERYCSLLNRFVDPEILQMATYALEDMATDVNDDKTMDDGTREARLTAIFAAAGVTLTFHGEYLGGFLGVEGQL